MKSLALKIIAWLRWHMLGRIEKTTSDNLFLTGRIACLATRKITAVSSLSDVEFRVSSQWGEDGIIDWLVERLEIQARSFVEFGVESYIEANTRFLLQNRNWRGLVMDANAGNIARIRRDEISWRHDLTTACASITRENIDDLIGKAGFHGEIGLLSIDIDGNDYWVWEALEAVSPIVFVCEYNAVFGDVAPIAIPYDPQFFRTQAHHSNLYFGASIAALRRLAVRKGYKLVGTNSTGSNAFFVRDDYAKRLDNAILDTSPQPSHARESRDERGNLTYLSGLHRLEAIAHLPVVNVETSQTIQLGSIRPIYSDTWLKALCYRK